MLTSRFQYSFSAQSNNISQFILIFLLLILPLKLIAEEGGSAKENNTELDELRSRIKNVESNIKSASDEFTQIQGALEDYEKAISKVSISISEIKSQISEKNNRLDKLHREKLNKQAKLSKEKRLLSNQLRTAYRTGQNDYIKLLLNQEDPALIGRILTYHTYYSLARTNRIKYISQAMDQLITTQLNIEQEYENLEKLQIKQLARLKEYEKYRDSRSSTMQYLQAYIDEQDKQLQLLQQNEEQLLRLINKLQDEDTIVAKFENLPPFNSLKGKLRWPVKGKMISRFGERKKGGRIITRGVTFSVTRGAEVKAVSSGKVIFANWFKNMGLLLILDHGDGFMSLYGHNETLMKKPGDLVTAGEIIGKVGDTGGLKNPSLYFEIRQAGSPKNPGLWCRS